jgi:hypothetical protein
MFAVAAPSLTIIITCWPPKSPQTNGNPPITKAPLAVPGVVNCILKVTKLFLTIFVYVPDET